MTYVSRRIPRTNQLKALEKMRGKGSFALLMGMRTGKTKPIVDEWGESVSRDEILDLLVVAPAGVYLIWPSEIAKDLSDEVAARTMTYTYRSGKIESKSAKRWLKAFMEYRGPRILLVNVEALSQVRSSRDICVEFGRQRPGKNEMVIDESVTIKNPEAKCSLFCVKELSPLFSRRRILTGLVSPRSPLDVYSQFKFLDTRILGFDKFSLFKARYARTRHICMLPNSIIQEKFITCLGTKMGFDHLSTEALGVRVRALFPDLNVTATPRPQLMEILKTAPDAMRRDAMIEAIPRLGGYIQTIPVIDGYDDVEEIHEKIDPYSFRVRLEDCYDMPPSDYSFRDVEMTDEQRRIYRELKEFATSRLSEEKYVTATHVITQMLRLHQVLCGHTRDEDGGWHEIPERRTKALIDLLSDYDGKAVVWCSYDADVKKVSMAIEREFGDGSVARFWGGNVETREEEEVSFKESSSCRFEVGTPDAGRFGRNWSVADLVVYYSSRNNLDHRDQSEMRVKDDGKTRPIAYVDLRVPGTVDDKIIESLRRKIDMAAVINGDNWREWLV